MAQSVSPHIPGRPTSLIRTLVCEKDILEEDSTSHGRLSQILPSKSIDGAPGKGTAFW